MTARLPIALVVHGHFYQPPRENPWSDTVEREPGAAPFHDWNARIHAECYRPNAFARIHDARGRIDDIVSNYERMSFDFGPTLLRWLERHDGRAYARIVAACGGAMAQAYAHPILPLCSPADRRTQIAWGLADFRRRFGRPSPGLWLPETAADEATLATLVELGVRFTILAPEQVAAVRAPGGEWTSVGRDTVDTGRAYRWMHPDGSGRFLTVAVFDGPLSRAAAFGGATRDADHFLDQAAASAERSAAGARRLVLCASDGELYGHHKKFADLTLAYVTRIAAARQGIEVGTLESFLDEEPATWEMRLAAGPGGEGSAWSCAHGVGRWRRHCGCASGGAADAGWRQDWRGPLRAGFDFLADAAARFYEEAAADLVEDPWGVRDAYGDVVDASSAARDAGLAPHGRPALAAGGDAARLRLRLLLEMQRATLLMTASCGWFFDDIGGLEAALVLRQAVHAVDLWHRAGGAPPEARLLEILGEARSNRGEVGTGADVWRAVSRDRVTPARALAGAVARAFAAGRADAAPQAGFVVEDPGLAGAGRSLGGTALVTNLRTGEEDEIRYAADAEIPGEMVLHALGPGRETVTLGDLDRDARDEFLVAELPRLAAQAADAAAARRVLHVVRSLAGASVFDEGVARRLLGLMLLHIVEKPGVLSADDVAVATELLAEAAWDPLDDRRRMVEEAMAVRLAAGPRVPMGVRGLARRVGFVVDDGTKEGAA